jgi:aminopeptidase N
LPLRSWHIPKATRQRAAGKDQHAQGGIGGSQAIVFAAIDSLGYTELACSPGLGDFWEEKDLIATSLRCLIAAACLFEPPASPTAPTRFAADRPADVKKIAIDARVDIPAKRFQGTAVVDVVALREISSIRFDAVDFDVSNVTISHDGGPSQPADYRNDGESIEMFFQEKPLPAGAAFRVEISYSIVDPESGLHFFGPSEGEPDIPYVVWSQGETTDNRYWIPCVDHPNEMQATEMIVTVSDGNEAISNGRLVNRVDNPDKTTTFHWKSDLSYAAYLMTLVVGEFHVEQEMWRGKPVVYYVPPEHKDNVKRSFGNTVAMLEYFSEITGVEYPWEKYAQVCVEGFGGGMENVSATTLGPRTLHDERAHLDTSSDGLVAHELAHQWFGDLVTCKDWAHLWLNEGFASYFDDVWAQHHLGQEEYEYGIYRDIQRGVEGGKKAPVVDRAYADAGDMFDSRSYPKGAAILHTLRLQVGDREFWASVKRYLTTNAHQPVETSDLRKAFERETGRGLERFLYDWTERPGAPSVAVSYDWIEEDKLAKVSMKQTQEADAFHFPLEVEFHFADGEPTMLRRDIAGKEQSFYFSLRERPTMVLVDPRQAVIMELKETKGRDLWREQLVNGPHVIDRIRAAKSLGDAKSDQDVDRLGEALLSEKFWGVGEAIAGALGEAGGERARDKLLAGLAVQHPKVRRAVVERLGSFVGDEQVAAALREIITKGDPSYRVEAEAIEAYAKLQPADAASFLPTLLNRPSHLEQIRSAALTGLGRQKDAAGLETLMEWSARGKPRECRQAAMEGLSELAENADLPDETIERIVNVLMAALEGERPRFQRSAVLALQGLGEHARPALPALRALAANDPESRTRRAASTAIEKIAASAPEQVQVKELRAELAKLRDDGKEMRERLEKLEAGAGSETER